VTFPAGLAPADNVDKALEAVQQLATAKGAAKKAGARG
jgi:hypothetical protein